MKRYEYITDEQVVQRAKAAVRLAIEKKKVLGTPIVSYDPVTNKVYQTNTDGSKTIIAEGIGKGRYSERLHSN